MSENETKGKYPHEGHRARLKKRFLHDNGESMEGHELLELLLFYVIPRRNTNEIAHALLARFGKLADVFSASVDELMEIEGIGENAAIYLKSISAAVRFTDLEKQIKLPKYTNMTVLKEYIRPLFSQLTVERLYILTFDMSMRMISCEKVCDGSVNAVPVNTPIIMRKALTKNAQAVVLAHNHPGGVACPSAADMRGTACYRDALEKAGILLVEHFLVANDAIVSIINNNQAY